MGYFNKDHFTVYFPEDTDTQKTPKILLHAFRGSCSDARIGGFSLLSFLVTFINNTAHKINASDDSSLMILS